MDVKLELDDVNAKLGRNGINLKISNGAGHVGDLRIGMATVEWMKGRIREGNGIKIPLAKLLELIEEYGK
jgi:hypothetical protein